MSCAGCGSRGPFYAGIARWCKECWKARVRANRSARRDYYVAYDKRRAMHPHRVEARRVYELLHWPTVLAARNEWARRDRRARPERYRGIARCLSSNGRTAHAYWLKQAGLIVGPDGALEEVRTAA